MQLLWYGKQLLQAALLCLPYGIQLPKTLASKHKTSLSKIIDKFNDGTGKWGIPYETKLGSKRRYFANYADCKGKAFATDYISNAAVVYG